MTTGNKIIIISIAVIAVITLTVLFVCLFSTNKENDTHSAESEETGEATEIQQQPEDETLDTTPKPIPELDEGNEIYLDADVIARLSEMELYGEEDLVNAILDGEMVLVNSFVNKGYSLRAVRQAQRFYFHFYDDLKNEGIESVVGKLTACFTTEGVFENSFSADAERLFGFAADTDYSYIFDMEDSQ